MKIVFTSFALLTLLSCNTLPKGIEMTNWVGKKVTMVSTCPENGGCSAERKPETELNFEANNELYPTTMYNPNTMVVTYEYNRNSSNEQYADDFYSEEIHMEIPAKPFKATYTGKDLEKVKLIFGKHCYCKGEAGFYKITDGTLKIDHKDNATYVKLTFKAPVTSLLQTVEFTVE